MTARFKLAFEDYDGWAICDTFGEYSNDEDYIDWLSGQKAVDVLNKLYSENKELKAKVDDKEVAVEVECEKLMQRVLDLIDEKIKELKNINNVSIVPRESIEALKQLKKELQG